MEACFINNNKVLEWTAPHTEQLFHLLSKNTETSGELPIDTINKKTNKNITIINGSESAVEAPESIVNYHTHPATCYINEKTVWGFPSGKDSRESILFGLKGSIAHLVVAVEGTYVCQVNPAVVDNLINLDIDKKSIDPRVLRMIAKTNYSINDLYRGLIILCVEIYFRSTHAFRTAEYADYKIITPDDYVNFSNNFNFKNMFKKDDIKECTKMKCNKVWTFEGSLKQVSFEKYVDDYESDQDLYVCSKLGSIRISKININKFIKNGGLEPIKNYNFTKSDKYPDINIDKWFLTNIFYHKVECQTITESLYKNLSVQNKQEILKQISAGSNNVKITKIKDPLFYFFDLSGNCNHNSIQKSLHTLNTKHTKHADEHTDMYRHKSNKKTRSFGSKDMKDKIVFFGSQMCYHCVEFLNNIANKTNFHKKFDIDINKFDEIGTAIDNAKKYSNLNIQSIPSVFLNKKLIDHHTLLKDNKIVYKEA